MSQKEKDKRWKELGINKPKDADVKDEKKKKDK